MSEPCWNCLGLAGTSECGGMCPPCYHFDRQGNHAAKRRQREYEAEQQRERETYERGYRAGARSVNVRVDEEFEHLREDAYRATGERR